MSSRAQRDKGQAQNTNQAILSELLKEEENRYCADCGAKGKLSLECCITFYFRDRVSLFFTLFMLPGE